MSLLPDLAVVYGVSGDGGEGQTPVVAVTLRPDQELTGEAIDAALAPLPAAERPSVVHVVDKIPVTTWFRPMTGPLREAGIPAAADHAWHLDTATGAYVHTRDPAAAASAE